MESPSRSEAERIDSLAAALIGGEDAARAERSVALEKAALLHGDWEPYLADLGEQAIHLATSGVEFEDWHRRVRAFRSAVRERCVDERDPLLVLRGLDVLLGRAVPTFIGAFLRAREARISLVEGRLQDQRLGFILQQLPVVAWSISEDGRLLSVVGGGLETLSPSEPPPPGIPLEQVQGPLRELLESGPGDQPRRFVRLGNHQAFRRHVTTSADGGVHGVAIDITESTIREQEYRHATKMEALGKLAGGVAHDFNNMLSAITSFTFFAREDLGEDSSSIRDDLDEVLDAAGRAAELVRQLLTFSRQVPGTGEPASVAEAAERALPMLRRLAGEHVTLEWDVPATSWWVTVDPANVESIIVNLVVNARDSLSNEGQVDRGRIEVTVANRRLDESTATRGRPLPPGEYVVISVSDNGTGIPPDLVERIFEPFFSTKPPGTGTGLGLSTIYGIAAEVGGTVSVYSEPGTGTTFRVYLPRAEDCQGEDSVEMDRPTLSGRGRTVLLVEDDEAVRRAVERMLSRLEYDVVSAPGMGRALALVQSQHFDIVLSDVIMPDGDGVELISRLKEGRPELPTVLMSGYSERFLREVRNGLPVEVLEKPIESGALAAALARALSG